MPIKYIPYVPNTVEGQAVLDNISRTQRVLRYRDNDQVISKIMRGMPYYEVEKQEQVGKASDNLVIRGECLSACAYLKEQGIKVDLVYIDPPFASGADYAKKVHIRRNPKLAENIAKAEEELGIDGLKAFEETMYGDIWKKEDYLNWMYENLMGIKSILSETGSIYVHLDYHIGHYAKILMDEVFGEDNFRSEIIWKSAPGHGDSGTMGVMHNTIYFYSVSNDHVWNKQYQKYDEEYLKSHYQKKEKDGRKFEDDNLTAYGLSGDGYEYEWNGVTKLWRCPPATMKKHEKNKRLYYTKNGTARYKRYLDEMPGMPLSDLWIDIPRINSQAEERVNYATQKPEALLRRIFAVSSVEGMVVADFFGGSGVTAKVAHDLGRKFIHVDIGLNSIQTTRDRLVEAKASFQILEIKDGVSLFRNPQQTMDKLAKLIPGLQQNVPGVGKFWFGALQDSKLGTVPVYVPNLINSHEKTINVTVDEKGNVTDIPLINKIINEELQNLEINALKAIVYFIDVDDRNAVEKFIKDNNATQTNIELKDLKSLLHHIVVEDEVEAKTTKTKVGFQIEIVKFVSDRLNQKINDFNEKGNLQSLNKGKKFSPISISEEGLELIEYLSVDSENAEGIWTSSSEIKIDKLGYVSVNGEKTKTFWDGKISADNKPLRLKIRNISGDESMVVFKE
jgi:adenine-specific DNA-methyltransferase